jgi:diaminohydroxyphosphoribosylaminopyrimidine deaminase/5-amino-6-(5-phosphoribosylamino)uracil reductase
VGHLLQKAAAVAAAVNSGFPEWIESTMAPLPTTESADGDPRQRLSEKNASEKNDEHFMREAIELAKLGIGAVEPNPMVGCVLVRDGRVLGKGYHQKFGGLHAEVEALRSLDSPEQAHGATAYVSLEPCCHHGKTPPCSQALIDAGLARVVVAMADPFPKVDGGGLRLLNSAGIETTVGVLGDAAEDLNAPYLKQIRTGRPWVIAKWAMTIDGRIATTVGQSQWITGMQARDEVHKLRSRVDGVAVGMGTVLADDPMLTARLHDPDLLHQRVAERIVFCQHRLPSLNSKLMQTANQTPLTLVVGPEVPSSQAAALKAAGANLVPVGSRDSTAMVSEALQIFGQQQMTNLMLEGGAGLLASFFSADQIDECHVYLGAKLFGGQAAKGPVGGVGIEQVTEALSFRLASIEPLGNDLRAVYRRDICESE